MSGSVSLELGNVGASLGHIAVLHAISCHLDGPGLVAIIGPNGAGKTTLLRAMAGLTPYRGSIRFNGVETADMNQRERAKSIGYLAQGHAVHWPLTARDVVALGRHPHGLADPARMGAHHAEKVEQALRRCDAMAFADRPIQALSGGERARVMLARVLAGEPDVIMADEPIAALDPRHQLTVMTDLKHEAKQGRLVLVVTHDLALAARFADQIILLAEGRLLAIGSPETVLTPHHIETAYGVRALHLTHEGQAIVVPWQAIG